MSKQQDTTAAPVITGAPANKAPVFVRTEEAPAPTQQEEDMMSYDEKLEHGKSLYISYFFAAWGDRMWEFAGIVFLMELFPGTLLPSSLFGLFETIAGIVGGTPVGKYIDSNDRLKVLKTSIIGQNVTVFCAGLVFALALSDTETLSEERRWQAAGVIIIAAMFARVSSALNKISIHKDWTVVVASGDSTVQTVLNSNMRRVDLVCSLLAPLMVGVLSMYYGPSNTCKVISVWSAVSLFIEIHVANDTYSKVAPLRVPKQNIVDSSTSSQNKKESFLDEQMSNLRAFRKHPSFGVSLPYCLLYMSVLSFHGTMVSFLRTLGWSDLWLAVGRGSAAVIALGSTVVVPWMKARYGLKKTGLFTLWCQILALAPLAVGFALLAPTFEEQKSHNFFLLIFITLCLSRFGLWGFDLAQTQLMQELVEPHNAGAVNGAQETLINFCWLVSFSFTIYFHDPQDFAYPAFMSFAALALAGFLYTHYYQGNPEEPEAAAPSSVGSDGAVSSNCVREDKREKDDPEDFDDPNKKESDVSHSSGDPVSSRLPLEVEEEGEAVDAEALVLAQIKKEGTQQQQQQQNESKDRRRNCDVAEEEEEEVDPLEVE